MNLSVHGFAGSGSGSGGSGISGTLTPGFIPVASDAHILADSILQDTGNGLLIDNSLVDAGLTINSSGGTAGLFLNDDGTGVTLSSTGTALFNDLGSSLFATGITAISIQLASNVTAISKGIIINPGNATDKYGILALAGIKNGFGINIAPTAYVHVGVGTTTIAPFRMTTVSAALTTSIQSGALEYFGNSLFFSRSSTDRAGIYTMGRVSTSSGTTIGQSISDAFKVNGLTNTAARAYNLASAAIITNPNLLWVVKDEAGTAATNNITINANGSDTIDGASSIVINNNYGSLALYTDGVSKWFTLYKNP